ncbi:MULTISPECIES: hypoxanthine phosphoribosyltransferase [Deinococcus]|uniref:Hypoxanthine phosphoribosyltransferase n=1 Tax=Deinococcus rufus TaxID=2136097 RepID=A0ABV7Z8W9_9DEIO|nr:hypoxanthine phosphoribosyltransferase [Deinococcus sp. AB2017081]WQE94497.1 hypoxanthine phosphoribosyltransferase [Deinococcus sp. AB2017081]
MSLTPGTGPVQITQEQLQARIQELAAKIRDDYRGREPHLICVLNGAFMFHADLVRALGVPCTIDFLQASSYGNAKQSSGEVRLVKDLQFPLSDRHVILVEDIVDTGITMNYLLHYLEGRGPASLKVAALLSKPSRRKVEVPVEYLGFTIPDAFVYGYGLDRSQYDRNLPFITSQD